LDQETVDVGRINSFTARLDKITKTRMVFMDSASWRWDPHEATQGELQGE